MSSPSALMYAGSMMGTGAAIEERRPGFRPKFIVFWNDDGDSGWWSETMADASILERIDTTGVATLEIAGGVTPKAAGFDLGDTIMNQATMVMHFMAFGA